MRTSTLTLLPDSSVVSFNFVGLNQYPAQVRSAHPACPVACNDEQAIEVNDDTMQSICKPTKCTERTDEHEGQVWQKKLYN